MNKLRATAFIIALLGVSFVNANEVYIEQVGDNSTITITQQGTGNKVGDALTPIFIGGGSNNVTIDQIGSSNVLAMVVNGAAAAVTLNTTGSGNQQTINCGTSLAAGCSSSTITQTITGDDNVITQNLGAGANHISNITVTGDTNTITHTSTSAGASTVNITANGSLNNIGVTQSGLTAQTVTINAAGNGNAVTINQSN